MYQSLRLLSPLALPSARVSVRDVQDPWRTSRESPGQGNVVTGSDSPEHWIAVHQKLQVCPSITKLNFTQCWASSKATFLQSCVRFKHIGREALSRSSLCFSTTACKNMEETRFTSACTSFCKPCLSVRRTGVKILGRMSSGGLWAVPFPSSQCQKQQGQAMGV